MGIRVSIQVLHGYLSACVGGGCWYIIGNRKQWLLIWWGGETMAVEMPLPFSNSVFRNLSYGTRPKFMKLNVKGASLCIWHAYHFISCYWNETRLCDNINKPIFFIIACKLLLHHCCGGSSRKKWLTWFVGVNWWRGQKNDKLLSCLFLSCFLSLFQIFLFDKDKSGIK